MVNIINRIECAAIRQGGVIYMVPRPGRHHNVIHVMIFEVGLPAPVTGEQGFLDTLGVFVNRKEARVIAVAAGQLLERASHSSDLFSECVW